MSVKYNENLNFVSFWMKFKNNRILFYISLINIFSVLVIWYFFDIFASNSSFTEISIVSEKQPKLPKAKTNEIVHKFRKNMLFLKSHKTASSTVQNILLRFGLQHSLNFLLPKHKNYLGYSSPIEDTDLDEEMKPPDGKYNLFVHHSRYHINTNKYLYDDIIRVTILRSPADLFESGYHFFNLDSYYGMSLQELLSSLPRTNVSFSRHKKLKNGYNQMSYDLGMDKAVFENETKIRTYIKFLDDQFDLVMIQEYLDASLVLLARFMGWPLDYVSSLPLNQRGEHAKYKLSVMDKFKLTQLNNADAILYNHFLRKFRDQVIKYGKARIMEDVQKLHKINDELRQKCILSNEFSGYSFTMRYKLKNPEDWNCVHATKSELRFTDEIQEWQKKRLKPIKKLYTFLDGSKSKEM